MVRAVLLLVLVGLVISLPLTALLVRLGRRLGVMDTAGSTGHAKSGLRDVPNIGGIAIFVAVALPLAVGMATLWIVDTETWAELLPALVPHLEQVRGSTPTGLALVAAMAVLHVVGVIDDRRSLGPGIKFAAQVLTACAMAIWFDVRLLELLGPVPSIVATVLWIIVITNAINFIDNMDGLAGGVALIAAAFFMVATILNEQWFIAGTLGLLVGALAGFLPFNFPPARIFMGDGGSLVVGFLLAVLTARTTYYSPDQADFALGTGWYGVFMPLVVLAIPIYDFVTVTVIRLRQGRSPFVGDQQHFSHRLVQRGLSTRGAVIVIWGVTAITGVSGIALGRLAPWQAVLVGGQTLLILVVIYLLEHASRHTVGRSDG